MTTARLSPAASLLRNSRLFALPQAIPLPTNELSSEPVPGSDTATSLHPTRATIETPLLSWKQGDWGLKRALPLKTTTNIRKFETRIHQIRIQGGIDTQGHVADFESAADHMQTVQKWQELDLALQLPVPPTQTRDIPWVSAFARAGDNTIDGPLPLHVLEKVQPAQWQESNGTIRQTRQQRRLAARKEMLRQSEEKAQDILNAEGTAESRLTSQPERIVKLNEKHQRWHYTGPHIASMSEVDFEQFLQGELSEAKLDGFSETVRQHMEEQRAAEERARSLDEGTLASADNYTPMSDEHISTSDPEAPKPISPRQVQAYIRGLRSKPEQFASLIIQHFDLAPGPEHKAGTWTQGRPGLSPSRIYEQKGPPRTHPSAGLSYLQTENTTIRNDATYGPQESNKPVIGRVLKVFRPRGPQTAQHITGIAGFVAQNTGNTGMRETISEFKLTPGGQKIVVIPEKAAISQDGSVQLKARNANFQHWQHNTPLRKEEMPEPEPVKRRERLFGTTERARREYLQEDEDVSELLGEFANSDFARRNAAKAAARK